MASLEYRNMKEVMIEDLLNSGLLNDREEDEDSLIEDALCATLSNVDPVYVINRADFFYSKSENDLDLMKLEIVENFNKYIKKFRNQGEGGHEWQD